ncbi:MAG: helix-turn-helix transcriptional regulator [Anaerolineae bacterium]|nr:helix-turn-helix transcriptional regulator [Anaerolineae bacterium]
MESTGNIVKYLPLTETTSYIMLTLTEPLHGYAIMQKVEVMSEGTVKVGAGTMYGALSTLEKEGLIVKVDEHNRRKSYILTDKGKQVLRAQLQRSAILVRNGQEL